MPYADRQKQLQYQRNWNKEYYKKNREKERKRIVERKKHIAQWLAAYKVDLSCSYCGEDEAACLDFHHRDGAKKEITISTVANWGWGLERIRKELKKCDVVCANCHRKVHAGIIK